MTKPVGSGAGAPLPTPQTHPAPDAGDTEEEAANEPAEEAQAAPIDLGATVALSPEALAALLEQVKGSRKKEE